MLILSAPSFRRLGLLVVLGMAAAPAACAHHSKDLAVRRVESHTQVDLSGKWNDTDAHLTSEALIYECFNAAWLQQFTTKQARRPAVRLGSIVNQTDEHIDAQVFVKNIERAMVNSGKVQVLVQGGRESDALAAEARREGVRPPAAGIQTPGQLGADYVGAVRMASMVDQLEGRQVKLYKINFELIDALSGEKAWIGDYEVKKLVSQGKWAL